MKFHDQEKYWDKVAYEKEFSTHFQIKEFEKYVSKEMKTLENSMNFRCPENQSQQTRSVCGIKNYSFNRFSRILDVGCGYGRTLNELYEKGFKNLTGVDFSKGMINRGLDLNPNLNLLKNDGKKLPFSDDEFDAVLLIAVLTCLPDSGDQKNMIKEIYRAFEIYDFNAPKA